ncbi:MAG: Rpn family recombination-promoting nuclease/putative transposase, partial [Clostridia bacterium]|nr:Rpn family recombination-promoting nuclease/putative transposase [Clostridia bacterium]
EKIINTYLVGNEKIKATDLERYKIKKYKAKTSDIIYKMKEKEKYYIVEYIEEIDETMPYRILNNCIDIIYEWSKNARFKNDINYPIVVPIVIYAGKGKWKKINKENINTIGAKVIENHEIEVKYNLIDINIITEEFLSEQKSLFRTRND